MGFLRLLLALSVVAAHSQTRIAGYIGVGGFYAVNVFFIISGFYMALVLNEKYRTRETNFAFFFNRILRLYPAYIVGLIVSIFIYWYTNSMDNKIFVFKSLGGIQKIYVFLSNIAMFGQDIAYTVCIAPKAAPSQCLGWGVLLNPPAWSISVEILFYAVAPFIVRSKRRTLAYLGIGVAYSLFATFAPADMLRGYNPTTGEETLRYYAFPSSFIFFAMGVFAYHFIYKRAAMGVAEYSVAVAAVISMSLTNTYLPWWQAILFMFAIPGLFNLTKNNVVDRAIGELSYPVYILHFPILLLIKAILPNADGGALPHPMTGAITALVATTGGVIVHYGIEKPIDRIRQRLAARWAGGPAGAALAAPAGD